jgi:hypothetical protein
VGEPGPQCLNEIDGRRRTDRERVVFAFGWFVVVIGSWKRKGSLCEEEEEEEGVLSCGWSR